MKFIDLLQIKDIFSLHCAEKISVSLSYKIYKLLKFITEDEEFLNNQREEIIQEFGCRDNANQLIITEAGYVQIQEGKLEMAQQKLNSLLETEVITPSIRFTIAELGEIKLSVADIAILSPLIDEK